MDHHTEEPQTGLRFGTEKRIPEKSNDAIIGLPCFAAAEWNQAPADVTPCPSLDDLNNSSQKGETLKLAPKKAFELSLRMAKILTHDSLAAGEKSEQVLLVLPLKNTNKNIPRLV